MMKKAFSLVLLLIFALPVIEASSAAAITNRPNLQINNSISLNWAGYVVASDFNTPSPVVTSVNGSWVVQTVVPSKRATYSSQWVGIGGAFDNSLIQTGTASESSGGVQYYYAWWETLPNAETRITGFQVSPGDVINAFVFLTDTSNQWNITLNDLTQNEHFSIIVSYASSQTSAEWIEERPSIAGSLTTLANFGTADYGHQYTYVSNTNFATVNGVTAAIGSLNYQAVTMVSPSLKVLATSTSLTDGGSSFTVIYGGSGHGGSGHGKGK